MRRNNTLALALSTIALTAILAAPALLPIAFAGSSGGAKGIVDPSINGFRVSLTSLTPVTTADVASGTALYLCTYTSDRMSIWSGSEWNVLTVTDEPVVYLTGLTADTNYDVFAQDSAGSVTIDATLMAWTNNTTRAVTLDEQDGVWTKGGDRTRRYVATVRATGAAAVDDTEVARFVFNANNRVERSLRKVDSTSSWTYTQATFRAARGDQQNLVAAVLGLAEGTVNVTAIALSDNTNASIGRVTGIDLDGSSAQDDKLNFSTDIDQEAPTMGIWFGNPGAGYHYWTWVEYSVAAGTTTWKGGSLRGLVGSVVN